MKKQLSTLRFRLIVAFIGLQSAVIGVLFIGGEMENRAFFALVLLAAIIATILVGCYFSYRITAQINQIVTQTEKPPSRNLPPPTLKLDHELMPLLTASHGMQLKLAELQQNRHDFLDKFTHEIRTPLTVILGETVYLQQKFEGRLPRDVHESLVSIHKSTNNLTRLNDDLSLSIKLNQGQYALKLESTDLVQLTHAIIRRYKVNGNPSGIQFIPRITDSTFEMVFDAGRIRQVLTNILNNAFQHTPRNGTITFTLTTSDQFAIFYIHNTGKHIPEEALPNLFNKFYQVNKKKHGMGLGLAIAQECMTLHEGEIEVRNDPDGGVVFIVYLPTLRTTLSRTIPLIRSAKREARNKLTK